MAGFPTQTSPSGTSLVTTEPAPTTEYLPIVTPEEIKSDLITASDIEEFRSNIQQAFNYLYDCSDCNIYLEGYDDDPFNDRV